MYVAQDIFVIKGNGDREKFSEEKILRTIRRVGVPVNLQEQAVSHIKDSLYQDIPTSEVYSHLSEFLNEENLEVPALKLNLKKAIFDLGPTGFPFEKYVGKIFESKGYAVEVGTTLDGNCVTHEIDVLIEKDGKRFAVEAKFHNQPGTRTDIQVALYTHARYLDIKEKNNISNVWIFTNTKLTRDAVDYCRCKGIHAVGWNYPGEENLQDSVERPNLYPITILTTLPAHTKHRMVENGIVLVTDLLETPKDMLEDKFLLQKNDIEKARSEARKLCGITGSIEKDISQ